MVSGMCIIFPKTYLAGLLVIDTQEVKTMKFLVFILNIMSVNVVVKVSGFKMFEKIYATADPPSPPYRVTSKKQA